MKKTVFFITLTLMVSLFVGCQSDDSNYQIAATTLPVYTFTADLCAGTDLQVCRIVTQNISCLHDYTLQSSQMRAIEGSDIVVISGAGMEDFMADALSPKSTIIDASVNVDLHCGDVSHGEHHDHVHDKDPHIWLAPENAKIMATNICKGLIAQYPQYKEIFSKNLNILTEKLDALDAYGRQNLSELSCRELITFHDGFSYFAEAFDLSILKAVEEDAGSEASAAELKELIILVEEHSLPAIFIEKNGSESAAKVIKAETGTAVYTLDMAMSGDNYFDCMYRNIDTVKEALE